MTGSHLLDRPLWTALNTGLAAFAEGGGRAVRLNADYGVFLAAAEPTEECLTAAAALVAPGERLSMLEGEPWPLPPGTAVAFEASCDQMIAEAVHGAAPTFETVELTDADAGEMLALAQLTEPGPVARRTNRLGGFIGVRDGGRLVAMAGERLRVPGFVEVSGVCTHPDYRGRGYAGGLSRLIAMRILARGEQPFLHVYTDNLPTVALYASLGFAFRRTLIHRVIVRA
ncbi:GNAT family N-acetyltransferase [Sphingomonas flavalba]|uniref:GNAT family N-acetyltransferase n=1 Tax=Sphingomonas flavalba TaxID=2559804 RepID=UPI0039E02FF0